MVDHIRLDNANCDVVSVLDSLAETNTLQTLTYHSDHDIKKTEVCFKLIGRIIRSSTSLREVRVVCMSYPRGGDGILKALKHNSSVVKYSIAFTRAKKYLHAFKNRDLIAVLKKNTSLRELSFNGVGVDMEMLSGVLKDNRTIQKLSLIDIDAPFNPSIAFLSELCIECIPEHSDCMCGKCGVVPTGKFDLSVLSRLPNLKGLELVGCEIVCDGVIETNLAHLSTRSISLLPTEKILSIKSLHTLDVSDVSEDERDEIVGHASHLERLSVNGVRYL